MSRKGRLPLIVAALARAEGVERGSAQSGGHTAAWITARTASIGSPWEVSGDSPTTAHSPVFLDLVLSCSAPKHLISRRPAWRRYGKIRGLSVRPRARGFGGGFGKWIVEFLHGWG